MDLSLIIPCYNEAQSLKSTVLKVRRLLEKSVYEYELVIAEDNSDDGTGQIAKELTEEFDNVIWLHRSERRGRGSAVSEAIRGSQGRFVGYIDVDLEVPEYYILPLILELENGADIATCSRTFKLNANQLVFRLPKVLSHYGYRWLVKRLLKVGLQDTEAGYKFFNRERILPVLDEIKDGHWFWDTEVMVRSYYKGYKIKEIPALYLPAYERVSKVNLLKDSFDYLVNLLKFRTELKRLGSPSPFHQASPQHEETKSGI